MKELVVCSGKGGTGKTSVVAAFAALARDKVLADCDADAADLHLVLAPEVQRSEPFVSGHEANILPAACNGCGICAEVCAYEAIDREETEPGSSRCMISPFRCEGCGVCVHFCPEQAIAFPERLCGEWYVSSTRHGTLVHARLGVAAENSGKLVTLVRQEARRRAAAEGRGLILVDGPPGIGCPTIASVSGADLLLAVSEPTLSAQHDLERLVQLAAHFQLPVAVCLNKHDLNPQQVADTESWCRERGLPVVGRIPYDPRVTAAQIEGVSVVEHGEGPAATAVQALWQETARLLGLEGTSDPGL
jgi:MinD superfamily P-loop ATPase